MITGSGIICETTPFRYKKTGYNIIMVEGKELLDKPVSINYSVFTDTDEIER